MLSDFEGLLAVIGLRNQQIINVNAEFLGVPGVERVLGIHERCHSATRLGRCDHLESDCGFA